ncbi:MAG TPA: hypothetical protein VMH32_09470 [Burkholderiales bacterium]|nr:hypothetical protein [Burkholderiales bacterium]
MFGLIGGLWKPLLGVLVIGGVVFYWYYLTSKIDKQALTIQNLQAQAADLARQRDDIKTRCAENEATLKKAIDDQNAQLRDFQSKAEALQKQVVEQQKKTQAQKQEYDKRIADIRQLPKPTTCDSSIKFLIDQGRKATWVGQ